MAGPPFTSDFTEIRLVRARGIAEMTSLAIKPDSPMSRTDKSPASPCTYTPDRAAFQAVKPCAKKPVITPVGTSPCRPKPFPGFPLDKWQSDREGWQ